MKKLLIILISGFFFLTANGQANKGTENKKDSINSAKADTLGKQVPIPSDTIEFINISDMNAVMNKIADQVTHNDFEKIKAAFNLVLREAITRREKKKISK